MCNSAGNAKNLYVQIYTHGAEWKMICAEKSALLSAMRDER